MKTKTAIVSGASSGIGLAVANTLLQNGFKVYNWDIQETAESKNNGSLFQYTDVRSVQNIEASALQFAEENKALDVLVCNSGIHRKNTLQSITEEEWDLVQNTNEKGTVFTVKHCLTKLKEAKHARVVLVGSDQCFIAKSESLAYGASKGSLRQLTKYLALELSEHSICLNTVCPGTIDTPLARNAFKGFADEQFSGSIDSALDWEAQQYPLKTIGKAEDAAEMVYYLATFKNNFTTGGLFKIEGGLTLG